MCSFLPSLRSRSMTSCLSSCTGCLLPARSAARRESEGLCLARSDGVAVDQPSLLVLDPQLAAALVSDDLARSIDCLGFGFRMRAGLLVTFLDHIPAASLLVRLHVTVAVVA